MFLLLPLAFSALTAPHSEKSFISWMRETGNVFTGDDYHLRFAIYLANQRRAQEHNQGPSSFTVRLNKFAALTPAEYKSLLGHRPSSIIRATAKPALGADPPDTWDWRTKNIVNAIKDQGQCGSCWAFSVIQAQESQWALQKTTLYSLSEQNLVDCVDTCLGCLGGDEYLSYDYVIQKQNGYWNLESDYPYEGWLGGSCAFDPTKGYAPIKSYFRPTTTANETELLIHCYNEGVVSIAIDASSFWFQLYSGGVFDISGCSSTDLDHAVGLIGYGTDSDSGKAYWLVRNSWGVDWGESGYIRMVRNKGNECGVATDVIIPQV